MNRNKAAVRGLLLLAAALALLSTLPCMAHAESEPIVAPINPAFTGYMQDPYASAFSAAESGYVGGLIPEPFDLSSVKPPEFSSTAVTTPLSYDLRPLNKLTSIRDQGQCGSCWDFAATGSLESSLMPAESLNFSENNLKNLAGFAIGCCSGGNRAMSTAYLARWGGAVAESDDIYNAGSCTSPAGLIPKKHVQDVIFLPNRSGPLDNDALKQAVMTYGAVYTTYYHSNTYYNGVTASYYMPSGTQTNHAVCIVGWDDNYSAGNFLVTPPGNGAFLIRNSWGTWWGMSGYFWMSYYDSTLGKNENAVYLAAPNTNYDQIYQYDPLGWISGTGYGSYTAWFANVFTATSNSAVAAASWYTPTPNSTYTLYVYTDPTSGSPLSSAGPLGSVTGTLSTAGYHTVQLPTTVPITAGQKFSVVVKVYTPNYSYPICLEMPSSGYSPSATASAGQSYMSSNGSSWTDVASYYANTNVCLKAFTSSSGAPPPGPGALSVTPATGLTATGTAGGPFSPASQAYTLTNTGQSAINWTASATKTWVGLSSANGTLAAGSTATVTVSINSTANTLVAGPYTDSVTFTNTTNGAGNATRSVSLTVNPAAGVLSVTPSTGLSASGTAGGPFSPASQAYTLTNTGGSAINWTATKAMAWVGLSSTGGSLAAGATTTVTVSINASANTLAAGAYTDSVSFANTTNGVGDTAKSVSLTVSSAPTPGALLVTPSTGLSSSGNAGGPFSPVSQAYTLTNTGGSAINWTASKTMAWVGLSSTGGNLAAGATATVTVSINSSANTLAAGAYSDAVSFANATNGVGNVARSITLNVLALPPPTGFYQALPTPYSWIDPTNHTPITMSDNSVSAAQLLPFWFTLYGKPYSRIYVGSNGLLGMITTGMTLYVNGSIPSASWPNLALCPYWDDLNPANGGSVKIGTVGIAPNRKTVISWVNVPSARASTARFTFQVILCETTNDIVFQYQNVATTNTLYGAGASATVGMENETGSQGCQFSYNTRSLANNMAIRFTTLPTSKRQGFAGF